MLWVSPNNFFDRILHHSEKGTRSQKENPLCFLPFETQEKKVWSISVWFNQKVLLGCGEERSTRHFCVCSRDIIVKPSCYLGSCKCLEKSLGCQTQKPGDRFCATNSSLFATNMMVFTEKPYGCSNNITFSCHDYFGNSSSSGRYTAVK